MTKIPFYVKKDEKPMSIGVFLSGSGTNFTAVAEYQSKSNLKEAAISFVFSNVPDCPGIKKAEDYGIKTYSLSSKQFFADLGLSPDDEKGRNSYDSKVLDLLSEHQNTDLIVLAGYRRKLSPVFYDYFGDRIINMYPGDITRDYLVTGVPASLQAIRNKDSEIACTVYIDNKNTEYYKYLQDKVTIYKPPIVNFMGLFNTFVYIPYADGHDSTPRLIPECKFYGKGVFMETDSFKKSGGYYRYKDTVDNFQSLWLKDNDEIISIIEELV